jgi:hypothetical protein
MGLYQTKKLKSQKTFNMNKQPTEWEKIFGNHTFGKWLVSKIY